MPPSPLHVRLNDAAGDRTFRAIAELTGQNHETVRRYMQGAAPSVDFVSAFCERLGLNANRLLTGRGPMKATDMRSEALALANPTELLTATAGNIEKLDDRVDRLEIFVSTMESRLRAAIPHDAAHANHPTQDRTCDEQTRPPGESSQRARRVADALPERPREDDR